MSVSLAEQQSRGLADSGVRRCRVCGCSLDGYRPQAKYCCGTCRALASRIARVLSDPADPNIESLANLLSRSRNRTRTLVGVEKGVNGG